MLRFRPIVLLSAVLLLLTAPAGAGFQLVLNNGRVLAGTDLERKADRYLLTLPDGRTLMVDAGKVSEVRLLGDDVVLEASAGEAEAGAPDGKSGTAGEVAPESKAQEEDEAATGQVLAGVDTSPRLKSGRPATVGGMAPAEEKEEAKKPAGEKPEPHYLAGDPQAPLSPGEWRPQSDWPGEPDWPRDDWVRRGPDPTWTPESDFATDPEANQFNPSTWVTPPRDPTWRPTDGFRKTNTAFTTGVVAPPAGTAMGRDRVLSAVRGASPAAAGKAQVTPQDGTSFATQEGNAAWYGETYRGRKTASGQRFDPDSLTGAHPSLPFGTLVMVTRLSGEGQSVMVEINDRGAGDRVINLSRAAAEALGMIKLGVALVRVEPVPDAPVPAAEQAVEESEAEDAEAGDGAVDEPSPPGQQELSASAF